MINIFLSLLIVLAGAVMNMSVILANGGMPVVGLDVIDGKWIPATEITKLVFYADRVSWLGFNIGDIVMIFGGLLTLYFILRLRYGKTN